MNHIFHSHSQKIFLSRRKDSTILNLNTCSCTRRQLPTSSSNQSSAHKPQIHDTFFQSHIPCTKPTTSELSTPAARTPLINTKVHNKLIRFSSSPKSSSAERVLRPYFSAKAIRMDVLLRMRICPGQTKAVSAASFSGPNMLIELQQCLRTRFGIPLGLSSHAGALKDFAF